MIINRVQIKNFKSFKGEHTFTFDENSPGLYHLSGENGGGKSTLFESIHWILFGTTSRGLKARDIHSWHTPGSTWGMLSLTLDQDHIIERQWSPNKLRLDGRDIEQSELDKLLPLTSETFQTAIYVPQFGDMFFDLKPTARLDLISNILQLDYWIDCSNKTSKKKNEYIVTQTDQQKKLEFIKGKMDKLVTTATSHEQKADSFDSEKDRKLDELNITLASHVANLKDLINKKNTLVADTKPQNELNKLTTSLNTVDKECLALEEQASVVKTELQETNAKIHKLQIEQAPYKKSLKKFTNLQDECTACGQEIPKAYKTKQVKEVTKQIADLEKTIQAHNTEISTINSKYEIIQKQLVIKNNEFETIKRKQDELSKKIATTSAEEKLLLNKIQNAETALTSHRKIIVEWEGKKNPYEQEVENCVKELEKLDEDREKLDTAIQDLTNTIEGIEYWTKTFKEIRLYVAEEILTNLEVRVNNYMNDLGLNGWAIKFDVEKENRSGGISKGFHIMITSPKSDESVLWEAWSGGEAQPLRLAGTLGLSDLILQSMGIQSNMLILDEPTSHMNIDGVGHLLDLLYAKAEQDGKQIWVVDHVSAHDFGGFTKVLQVINTDSGSLIT